MNMLFAEIRERDWVTPVPTSHFNVKIGPYSNHAIGGSELATLEVTGNPYLLMDMLRWLRYGVVLHHRQKGEIWWGYIAEVRLQHPAEGLEVSVTLDEMYNRIKVAYTEDDDKRRETDWAQDDDSVDRYGKKEQLVELPFNKLAKAERARNRALRQLKYPTRDVEISESAEFKITLLCRGWWDTLSWQLYRQRAGEERYIDNRDQRHRAIQWGDAFNYVTSAAQKIQLIDSEPWYTDYVEVLASKRGDGGGNLIVELCSDNGNAGGPGLPGTVRATATIAKENIPEFTSFGWVRGNFDTEYELQTGTNYWLVFRGSGANSIANHLFIAGSKRLGYPRGVSIMYLNGSWRYNTHLTPVAYNVTYETAAATDTSGNNYDTSFRVFGLWTTKKIISEALDTAQFLTYEITSTDSTGTEILTDKYYPEELGDATIKEVVEEAMESGTSDDRRLIAKVNGERVAQIYPEPEDTEYAYQYSAGKLYDKYDAEVPWALCPAGVWLKLRNFPPDGVPMIGPEDPRYIFVERMEYDPDTDRPTSIELRDMPSPWAIYEG